jgi:ubiquinol-cytochrome c reductase cytochrome c1 subunit
MPDVLASLQGLQKPVDRMGYRFGQRTEVAVGVKPVTAGAMSPAQFHAMTRDLVSFLYYVAHPHQQEREAMGKWVLLGLALLTGLSFALYKLYWREVVPPEGKRWWTYWRR